MCFFIQFIKNNLSFSKESSRIKIVSCVSWYSLPVLSGAQSRLPLTDKFDTWEKSFSKILKELIICFRHIWLCVRLFGLFARFEHCESFTQIGPFGILNPLDPLHPLSIWFFTIPFHNTNTSYKRIVILLLSWFVSLINHYFLILSQILTFGLQQEMSNSSADLRSSLENCHICQRNIHPKWSQAIIINVLFSIYQPFF